MENSDRELLEFAAKAAGYKKYFSHYLGRDSFVTYDAECYSAVKERRVVAEKTLDWNPLANDDDALRLAVKLGLVIEYRREVPACFAYHYNSNLEVVQRNDQLDPYAATRRAIVRAAAEIGRNMK